MTFATGALLFVAAAIAGALNGVAGGGSFVSFPALLFAHIPPVTANATNTVAVWPAGIASAYAYRGELRNPRKDLARLVIASVIGGAGGATLLLITKDSTFVRLIPYLLFVASAIFTAGPWLTARLRARSRSSGPEPTEPGDGDGALFSPTVSLVVQLVISVYGGYFGGGMGIMMMAVFTLSGMTNIHAMNGLKNILSTAINGVAIIAFVIAGAVAWAPAGVMVAGGLLGGYGGAAAAQRLNAALVRRFALFVAWGMTIYFFFKR